MTETDCGCFEVVPGNCPGSFYLTRGIGCKIKDPSSVISVKDSDL